MSEVDQTVRSSRRSLRRWSWRRPAAATVFVLTSSFAWFRVGMLDLPAVPRGLSLADTGLADLEALKALDDFLGGSSSSDALMKAGVPQDSISAAEMVYAGFELIRNDEAEYGLEMIQSGVRRAPATLALCNAYRMAVFKLQREFLQRSHAQAVLTPAFPPFLDNEPMEFFEALLGESDAREIRLHLALAWVDRMLLFPALEIKAPSSVEAVGILTSLLDDGNAGYVPALFARGLNRLHRPARLVWPESQSTSPDAAARDIGLCIAIGRRFRAGSSRLHATLAIALGDSYVKAGRLGVARSWWQIAQNLSDEPGTRDAVRRRYGWQDGDILEQLERDLDRARSALDEPMTNLAMMWN